MFRKFRQTNISTAKSDALGSIHISVTGYVTLGKLFNLSKLQFPLLLKEENSNTLWWCSESPRRKFK